MLIELNKITFESVFSFLMRRIDEEFDVAE